MTLRGSGVGTADSATPAELRAGYVDVQRWCAIGLFFTLLLYVIFAVRSHRVMKTRLAWLQGYGR